MITNCRYCGIKIKIDSYRARNAKNGNFCSRKCYNLFMDSFASQRFWSRVNKTDSCWIWTGNKSPKGYGIFYLHGRAIRAHRLSWEMENGKIPEGMLVCHNCPCGDNPSCVNPEHMFLGTAEDNINDAVKKGTFTRGSKSWSCRLTEKQVLEIRRLHAETPLQTKEIARQFGIKPTHVSSIAYRRIWRHI